MAGRTRGNRDCATRCHLYDEKQDSLSAASQIFKIKVGSKCSTAKVKVMEMTLRHFGPPSARCIIAHKRLRGILSWAVSSPLRNLRTRQFTRASRDVFEQPDQYDNSRPILWLRQQHSAHLQIGDRSVLRQDNQFRWGVVTGSVSRGVGRPDLDHQPQQLGVRRRGPPEVAVASSALPSANGGGQLRILYYLLM
jgi:hypothetical protein